MVYYILYWERTSHTSVTPLLKKGAFPCGACSALYFFTEPLRPTTTHPAVVYKSEYKDKIHRPTLLC